MARFPSALPVALSASLAALLLAFPSPRAAAGQEEPPPGDVGEKPEEAEESDLWKDVVRWYEAAKERGEKVPGDIYEWVRQDLQSLGDWEYLVVELESRATSDVQAELSRLGAERWELTWAREVGARTQFILKRPARSYLQQLPARDLLRLVPGGGGSD